MEGYYLSGVSDIVSSEGIAVVESSYMNSQRHYHKFVELVYFDSGSGLHSIGNEQHKVSSGDLYILNPFVSHEFHANKGDGLSVINIMFYIDFFDFNVDANTFIADAYRRLMGRAENDLQVNYIHLHGDRNHSFGKIFREMIAEFNQKEDGYLRILHNQLSMLLIYIFREYVNAESKLGLSVWQKRCVEKTIKYIDEHFVENISVEMMSKGAGFCPQYLNKMFKLYTGQTIPQYVRAKRIEFACRLLSQTDKSIEQICVDIGYSDIKHFYKFFKEYKKMTPGEYRKKSDFYINR